MTRKYKDRFGVGGCYQRLNMLIERSDSAPSTWSENIDYPHAGDLRTTRSSDPDWRTLIQTRKDASGAYYRREVTFKPRCQVVELDHTPWVGVRARSKTTYIAGWDVLNVDVQSKDDAALKDLALKRLKQKLSSRSNQVQVMAPIAELREFRDLIKSLTFAATDLAVALLEIKRTKGKSAAKFASHAWLNWSFAVAPTISDIQNIRDAIADHLLNSGNKTFTDYGASKKEWHSSLRSTRSLGYADNTRITFEGNHRLSYRYVCGYKTPLRSSNDYSNRFDFGIEVGAIVPTLWELTAFSWLFDYFSTIGDYLEDTFTTDQTKTIYVNCTKKYNLSGTWTADAPRGVKPVFASSVSGSGSSVDVSVVERSVLTSLPARQLRLKTTDEIGKSAINKLLNLCSIAIGGKARSNHY